MKDLLTKGLVKVSSCVTEGSPGRPENIYGLSEWGRAAIRETRVSADVPSASSGQSEDTENVGHQLLLNWVRIRLAKLEATLPRLAVSFLSPAESIEYRVSLVGDSSRTSLIPDGICSITDVQLGKSLLFFIEIDMGTESLSGSSPGTIWAKIRNYEQVFRAKSYKKFEVPLSGSFLGFRVLLVANTQARLVQLSRLTKSVKSADFVWLTDRESLFENGIADKIWVKGGREEEGLFSILGPTLSYKSPVDRPN